MKMRKRKWTQRWQSIIAVDRHQEDKPLGQNGGNLQKENKPANASGERILGKSLNKEEKEEQLKNLLIDFQDLNKHKYKSDSQKQKMENDENDNFEEDESNRVYARYFINFSS